MAVSHGKAARVLVGGYNLSGYVKQVDSGAQVDMEDSSVLTSEDREYIPGLGDGVMSGSGLFHADGTGVDAAMYAAFGDSEVVIEHLPYGDVLGYRGRGCKAQESQYSVESPVDGLVSTSFEVQSSSGIEPIIVHRALATGAGGGTTTSIDNAGSSTGGAVGYLQVTALTGGTADVTIQHSADDAAYVDLVTFTDVTTAPAAERIVVTGTVNRYTRVVSSVSGGTATFHVALGRK